MFFMQLLEVLLGESYTRLRQARILIGGVLLSLVYSLDFLVFFSRAGNVSSADSIRPQADGFGLENKELSLAKNLSSWKFSYLN